MRLVLAGLIILAFPMASAGDYLVQTGVGTATQGSREVWDDDVAYEECLASIRPVEIVVTLAAGSPSDRLLVRYDEPGHPLFANATLGSPAVLDVWFPYSGLPTECNAPFIVEGSSVAWTAVYHWSFRDRINLDGEHWV